MTQGISGSLAEERLSRRSRRSAAHEPDQCRKVATQPLQMSQIDLSQSIDQEPRMRAGRLRQGPAAFRCYVQVNESSVRPVAHPPDQALPSQCLDQIAGGRLVQCHALRESVHAHAFPSGDLRESPHLRAGDGHRSAHLRIMPARRRVDQPQALKCVKLDEVPRGGLRFITGTGLVAAALGPQRCSARASTGCPASLRGRDGTEPPTRSACDPISRHTRKGRLYRSGRMAARPAPSFRLACRMESYWYACKSATLGHSALPGLGTNPGCYRRS